MRRYSEVIVAGVRLAIVSRAAVNALDGLTPAEREVARSCASGKSCAEMARERGTSVHTVANQLGKIYSKLGASGRAELTALIWSG
jgi:DNA-binding CsgD family transcriptional regulator